MQPALCLQPTTVQNPVCGALVVCGLSRTTWLRAGRSAGNPYGKCIQSPDTHTSIARELIRAVVRTRMDDRRRRPQARPGHARRMPASQRRQGRGRAPEQPIRHPSTACHAPPQVPPPSSQGSKSLSSKGSLLRPLLILFLLLYCTPPPFSPFCLGLLQPQNASALPLTHLPHRLQGGCFARAPCPEARREPPF